MRVSNHFVAHGIGTPYPIDGEQAGNQIIPNETFSFKPQCTIPGM
jgi:hypothetical protein